MARFAAWTSMTADTDRPNPSRDTTGPQPPGPTSDIPPPTAQRQPPSKLPIVAIGASAGGLEALQAFFSGVPADSGIGFVVVTHTRPERKSLLPELLAQVTSIPVVASDERTRVAPDKVIIAKDSLLGISGGMLDYAPPSGASETSHHPIDHLFRALASDQREHAIGIILSGSGSDGSLGVKAIKAAGGMVMVQDPATAKHAGMPDSALATGLADYVLPPQELPAALVDYCRGPFLTLAREPEARVLHPDAIDSVLTSLRGYTGHDFTSYKKSTMARRIERRMNVHRIDEPQVYVRYLREHPQEREMLIQELLISVTSFFRDPYAFEALGEALGRRLEDRGDDGQPLRVWVAGCATGEEAYSVAILLDEQVRGRAPMQPVQIFATDLDERAIKTARAGLYPEGITADVSSGRLQRYFTRENGSFRVRKHIRDRVVFAVQNILSDPPFTNLDLLVCRNLLIYLDAAAQQRVLPTMHYALRPGGVLFLGTSETLGASGELFETIDGKHKILRRRETARPVHPVLARPPGRGAGDPQGRASATQGIRDPRHLSRSIERLLLQRYAPCSVVVDERGTIAHLHGPCGRYLQPEQGQPRNRLLDMARSGLGAPLSAALAQVRDEHQAVVRSKVRVRTGGESVVVRLTVAPLSAPEVLRGLLLVTFEPVAEPAAVPESAAGAPPPADPEDREALERELQHTRESLQSTIEELETSNEELKSSNEELQSTNEELYSTNEELETSREEMQSLNEELNTLNTELQSSVDALSHVNDDMGNLLNSMQVATIFLDQELQVRRYTEGAKDVVRLIDSDIGRPLSDLSVSLEYDELTDDCREVLATLIPKEEEVQDAHGRWHLVRVLPYRTADNVIDGVVITAVDIDRTKRAERGQDFFEAIVQTVREPLVVLDGGMRVVRANDAFYRVFVVQPKDTEDRAIYDLGNREWDIPELRRLLEDILPAHMVMTDYRVEHEFPRIGRRSFLLNARRLQVREGERELILLAFEDVTEESQ
jgi:two-component system, chemotaxis family, CheB/CheR fusion protein